jgi:hypothetical protein
MVEWREVEGASATTAEQCKVRASRPKALLAGIVGTNEGEKDVLIVSSCFLWLDSLDAQSSQLVSKRGYSFSITQFASFPSPWPALPSLRVGIGVPIVPASSSYPVPPAIWTRESAFSTMQGPPWHLWHVISLLESQRLNTFENSITIKANMFRLCSPVFDSLSVLDHFHCLSVSVALG